PVVFQIIHAPSRVLERILIFMSLAPWPSCARFLSCVRIQSEFQTFCMNVIRERFHSGRESLRIRDDESVSVAAHLPAIVNYDVLVTRVLHLARNHCIRHGLDHLFADVATKLVPAVPAHRWSQRHSVVPSADSPGKSKKGNDRETKKANCSGWK